MAWVSSSRVLLNSEDPTFQGHLFCPYLSCGFLSAECSAQSYSIPPIIAAIILPARIVCEDGSGSQVVSSK